MPYAICMPEMCAFYARNLNAVIVVVCLMSLDVATAAAATTTVTAAVHTHKHPRKMRKQNIYEMKIILLRQRAQLTEPYVCSSDSKQIFGV